VEYAMITMFGLCYSGIFLLGLYAFQYIKTQRKKSTKMEERNSRISKELTVTVGDAKLI